MILLFSISSNKKYFIYISLLVFTSSLVLADQTKIPNYAKTQKDFFWQNLYSNGGFTFYCGEKFVNRHTTEHNNQLSIEHIVPAQRMVELFGCGSNRTACQQSGHVRFGRMEADMHNMYPVLGRVNSSRSDLDYGIITGDVGHFRDKTTNGLPASFVNCDFERETNRVEPRDITKGNIARAYFYMAQEYGLTIDSNNLVMLKKWHKNDPVNCNELKRNSFIEKIQGTRNKFIDQPSLVDDF